MHLGSPSSIDNRWTVTVKSHDFRTIYNNFVVRETPLPLDWNTQDLLLVLLALLADVNALFFSLGSLTTEYTRALKKIESMSRPTIRGSTPINDDPNMGHYNPFVPYTADSEYRRKQTKLVKALETWQEWFAQATASPMSSSRHSDISPLCDFAKLLLEYGPVIRLLSSLAGYMPREHSLVPTDLPVPCAPSLFDVSATNTSAHLAMVIIDSADVPAYTGHEPFSRRPVWYPILIFYSALTLWTRTSATPSDPIPAPTDQTFVTRSLLKTAMEKLYRLKGQWRCAGSMAETLAKLL